jgi:hypothetical protein
LGPGNDGIYNLCNQWALETPKYTFYTYPLVVGVWDKVQRMRKIVGLPLRFQNWWKILSGVHESPVHPDQAVI